VGLFFRRALQVIGMCGIVALGGLVWRQSIDNSFIEACVFGMIGLAAIALGAGFLEGAGGTHAAIALMPIEPGADSVVRVAEQRFAADIALVVKLLQSHLAANTNYTETLTRANADLPQLRSTEEIRSVVLTLIDENRKVQVKIDELSKTLDESVNKFEKLRTNLADANDKAMRDSLTGLGNRRFFDQELDLALEDDPVVCLLMCDLDNFKAINDKFGHAVGDMVLKQFADILNAAARRDDLAARLGGEEFAMVMPAISPVDAARVADHVRRQLEGKKWMLGGSVALGKVTASFGVARRRAGETAAEFFKRADAALYRAKADGRNRVVLDIDA
jgi:diguanylate cyclase